MRRTRSVAAAVLVAAASTVAVAGTPAAADVPQPDYHKYVTISGPNSLVVGGGWGVWTLQAKNPNAVADTQDHLVFNSYYLSDSRQLQLEYRAGSTGNWAPAPVKWYQMSSNPKAFPAYLGSLDLTGKALHIAPHSALTFQIRARRVATATETQPFPIDLSAYLTPAVGPSGQGGNFVARADTWAVPLGLTTKINGLPTTIPADGKSRLFQVHMTTLNHANWQIPSASFFVWQGQKHGSMGGPSACDAEIDVYDVVHHSWHKVGMGAAGVNDMTVDLAHWATGPAWDRTLNARITLGAGFRTDSDATIGFGYYPGSGDPDYFWVHQPLKATAVAGAHGCVKPASAAPASGASTSAPSAGSTTGGSGGPSLASTGGGSDSGLLAGAGAALVALGGGVIAVLRRRARRA